MSTLKAVSALFFTFCVSRSLFHFAAVRPSASPPSLAGSERRTDRSRTDGRTDTPSLPAMGAETGLRRSWALLAFLGVAVASRWGAAAAEVYTNTWAVRVIGGAGEADRIARKHGFVNHGNVGPPPVVLGCFGFERVWLLGGGGTKYRYGDRSSPFFVRYEN